MATALSATPAAAPVRRQPHDRRLDFLRALPQGACVLDAGGGSVAAPSALRPARPDLHWFAVGMAEAEDGCAPECNFVRVDLETETLPFSDQQFDGILFCHVLEHLVNRRNVLREFTRLLKPGGTIYIEGPSTRALWLPSLPGLASRGRDNAIGDDLNFFDNFNHVRPLTRRGLAMFLQMAGCRCERSGHVRHRRRVLAAPFLLLGGLLLRRRRWVCVAVWELLGWNVFALGRKAGPVAA